MDKETWIKALAAIATFIAASVGMLKIVRAVWEAKADTAELKTLAERHERHQKANEEQIEKHHRAILHLYEKNDKVVDLIREKEERDTERHIAVLTAIHDSKR